MARRRNMSELKEIVRRLRGGQSIREIHKETRMHRRDIRELRALAERSGWLDAERLLPDEFEIREARESKPGGARRRVHSLDAFQDEIKHWVAEEYSIVVMQELLKGRFDCDESTVRRYVKYRFPETPRAVIRRDTIPGAIMEVDFGYLGLLVDEHGRQRRAYVFSARLNHSRRAYREIVFDQKQETFFACHIHAFEYFGGVPEKVVPDNLKAAVIVASFEDPQINRTYMALAEYYGFWISPTLPRTPQHKGGVENDIKYIKHNFWPVHKEKQRQLGRDVPRADEMIEALSEWSEQVAHVRILRSRQMTPLEIFETEEAATLKPLPLERWDIPVWVTCKVMRDWRIQFGRSYYSVPYRLVGQTVQVCATTKIVRVFHDLQEICRHERSDRHYEVMRKAEHAPPNEEHYLAMTRQAVLRQAQVLGEHVLALATRVIDTRPVDMLRPVRAILKLSHKYTPARLNAACKRALYFEQLEYIAIKHILAKGLEDLPLEQPASLEGQLNFRFARTPEFFDISEKSSNDEHGGMAHG